MSIIDTMEKNRWHTPSEIDATREKMDSLFRFGAIRREKRIRIGDEGERVVTVVYMRKG